MHDVFELEQRGVPVAYIDTPGRVPHVERDGEVFVIDYATNRFLAVAALPQVPMAKKLRTFERMGIHRALRMAGAKPGDRVRVDNVEFDLWDYPPPISKRLPLSDGVRDYPYIQVAEGRIGAWTPEQVSEWAPDLVPRVVKALVRKRRSG